MAVSIWEGSKAQDLINAITNTQKIDRQQGVANAGKALIVGDDGIVVPQDAGLSDSVKLSLLACFQNVAWTTDKGKTLYDDLLKALYEDNPHDIPDWDTDYTWLYVPKTNGLLSAFENVSEVTSIGGGTPASESIVGEVLNIVVQSDNSNHGSVYNLLPATASNAVLKMKVRFNELPNIDPGAGLRFQVSNGTNGAQLYVGCNNGQPKVFTFKESTLYEIANITLNEWHKLSCELSSAKQVITIDDTEYPIEQLSSYANTKTRIIFLEPSIATVNLDIDIAWITFKNNE